MVEEGSSSCVDHANPGPEREGVCRHALVLVCLVSQCLQGQTHTYTAVDLYYSGDPSNPDTNGTEESVNISAASLYQGLRCTQELFLGEENVSHKGSKFFTVQL